MQSEEAFKIMGEFATIFDLTLKDQRVAVSMFDEMAQQNDNIYAHLDAANGAAIKNQWDTYVSQQADELARQIDPAFAPGSKSGNKESTMIFRSKFYGMFTSSGKTGEQIRKAKTAIEDMMVG